MRRTTVEGSPLNQAREEEFRLKDQHRPVIRPDSRADQRKPKPIATAWGSVTARRPKSKPNKRRESNVTNVDWGRTQTGPEIGDLTWRFGTPQDLGVQRHSSATRAANKYLTKNQVNNLHSEATEGGPPRRNLNHLKPAANTGSEREEPKVRPKKTAGAWTTQQPESPRETKDTGRGAPPKEGRNRGTDAAY